MDEYFAIIRTIDLKGHRERVMIVAKSHTKLISEKVFNHALEVLRQQIPIIFNYTYKAVVMEGKYGSIPDHWHLCITDLEEDSFDHQQILGTPWIEVIDIKDWDK